MPNWCYNRWEISASSEEEAKAILDLITHVDHEKSEHRVVTFRKIAPMPEILNRTISGGRTFETPHGPVRRRSWMQDVDTDGKRIDRLPTAEEQATLDEIGHSSWYSWANENWGTKWDAASSDVELEGDFLRLTFDTAWSPPVPIVEALRERFPDAHISAFWDEPGVASAGYL